ncbi:MAG: hypothetical protein H6994_18315 [Pseudomonadales bacterium]|nr:hypothetical protein [Pseudomonadales bacterium]
MLLFDRFTLTAKPSHFVLLDWGAGRVTTIRDFLFAGYAVEAIDWSRL